MHYANGREAKVGDPVVGTCYNTRGIVAGLLAHVTPGSDTCNASVLFFKESGEHEYGFEYAVFSGTGPSKSHWGSRVDYTACDKLLHAEDAFNAGTPRAAESCQTSGSCSSATLNESAEGQSAGA